LTCSFGVLDMRIDAPRLSEHTKGITVRFWIHAHGRTSSVRAYRGHPRAILKSISRTGLSFVCALDQLWINRYPLGDKLAIFASDHKVVGISIIG